MDPTALPRPGFGTWDLRGATCTRCVERAIEVGYRHLDTATVYDNEGAVGAGLRRSGIDRGEVVVATKLGFNQLHPRDVGPALEASLDRLQLGRLDLLYVHWPAGEYDAESTLGAMAELVDDGPVDALGVSNFTVDLLEEAMDRAGDVIVAHQFELHPYLPNEAVRERTREFGLDAVAYSPLARGIVLEDPTVRAIADRRGVTPAQVVLAWAMTFQHVVPIPKSSDPERIAENYGARRLVLTEDERDRIDAIETRRRVCDPSHAPW